MAVAVIDPVAVAVHVHGNDTGGVIGYLSRSGVDHLREHGDDRPGIAAVAPPAVNGVDHDHGSVHVHGHGVDHVDGNDHVDDHG